MRGKVVLRLLSILDRINVLGKKRLRVRELLVGLGKIVSIFVRIRIMGLIMSCLRNSMIAYLCKFPSRIWLK